MKNILPAFLAAAVGAIGFHAYYLSLDRAARCGWDTQLGRPTSDACRMTAEPALYDRDAREKLNDLVGNALR